MSRRSIDRNRGDRDPVVAAKRALEAAQTDATQMDLSWIRPIPEDDGWTLAVDALQFLGRVVRHLRPRHILEFGSGLSTKVLARVCDEDGIACRISSLDHDPEFGRAPKLDGGGTAVVRHQVAPLVARDCGAKLLPWYLLNAHRLASRRPPDLVVIDGPPLALGGREGTLYQIMDIARRGSLVLLDDAARQSEREAMANWEDTLREAIDITRLRGFVKGLAAILVLEPIPARSLWDRKVRQTIRDIESSVGPGNRFVLIGNALGMTEWSGDRRCMPLVLRRGEDWGPPESATAAEQELENRRNEGATHLVLPWTDRWWLECYAPFFDHVAERYAVATENDRCTIWDLERTRAAQ